MYISHLPKRAPNNNATEKGIKTQKFNFSSHGYVVHYSASLAMTLGNNGGGQLFGHKTCVNSGRFCFVNWS